MPIHVGSAGFTICFPCSWDVHTDVPGLAVVGLLPDQLGGGDNVGVVVEQTGRPQLTVHEYLVGAVELAPRHIVGFRAIAAVERLVEDQIQGVLEYTGQVAGRPLHFLASTVVRGDRAFTATFTAQESTYAGQLPIAEPVLETLRAL